jgi:hypothetical protein
LDGVEPLLLHLASTVFSWDDAMECMTLGLEVRIPFGAKLVEACVKTCGSSGAVKDVAKLLETIHSLEQPNCIHRHCQAALSRQQRNMPELASRELVAGCPGMLTVVLAEIGRLEKAVTATTDELPPPDIKGPYAAQIRAFYVDGDNEISMTSLPNARKAAKEINAIPGIRKYLTAAEVGRGSLAYVRLKPSSAMQSHRDWRAQVSDLRILRELIAFSKSKRCKK